MTPSLDYLRNERKLTDETIQQFRLGYCDPNGFLYMYETMPHTAISLDPRFRDAVLFPIFNLYDDLIAFSARPLNKLSSLKYVNTIYPKAAHLFGLNITWEDCLKERTAYIVEGNVDVMMMWQHGIKNVVGMLGSNIATTQLCLLSRFVDKIIFVPDGDTAGEKFIQKIKKAVPHKFSDFDIKFSIITLPLGYDPDKYLQEKGKDELVKLEQDLSPSIVQQLGEIGGSS